MESSKKCPDCGNMIPVGPLVGLCPYCEMTGAMALAPVMGPLELPITIRYFGDYELLEEIARGGMGIVFKARQVSLNRIVAVKMILSGHMATPDEVKRFRTEGRAAAGLRHPNIVPIYDVGSQDGQNYFSMEFVDGQNLAQVVREHPLSSERAARYVHTIAEAIQYAHEHDVLRIRPGNDVYRGERTAVNSRDVNDYERLSRRWV